MRFERAVPAAAAALMLFAVLGCEDTPTRRKTVYKGGDFLHNNAWVVPKPDQAGPGGGAPGPASPTASPGDSAAAAAAAGKAAQYKVETEVVSPILNAKGKWTVRLAFYKPNPQKGLSALYYANLHARELLKKGYEPYVTDLLSLSIVSLGSFEDQNDPKLIELWRTCYEDWLKIYQGRKSPFREAMEQFYGDKTIFGDQPWPVSIIDLQVKMKGAYRIPLTQEDERKHKEYLSKRVKTGENP